MCRIAFYYVYQSSEDVVVELELNGNAVTEPTFDKLGDGTATIEYKKKDADDSTYTATAPSTAGDYVVCVTVAESRNHKEAFETAAFSIE